MIVYQRFGYDALICKAIWQFSDSLFIEIQDIVDINRCIVEYML